MAKEPLKPVVPGTPTRGISSAIQASILNVPGRLVARQEVRYLIAGAWNTVFGYGVYAGPYYLLHGRVHYMVVAAVGSIVAISMAYATHKLFVFRTKGNVLREYLKFCGVYGVTSALGLVALPFCVELLGMSPYVAPLLILAVTVVVSYLAHKHFSFK
jgi:putative flippase GtrA